jgi:hypothetical protein
VLVSTAISRGAPHELLVVVSYHLLCELVGASLLRDRFHTPSSPSSKDAILRYAAQRADNTGRGRRGRARYRRPGRRLPDCLERTSGAEFLVSGDSRHVPGFATESDGRLQ